MPERVRPLAGDWRKVRRDAEDAIRNAVLVQNFPERFALTKLFCAAASQRNHPATQVQHVFRRLYPRSRKIRLESLGIAMNKIEDTVTAGIHSRNQIRPSHGLCGGMLVVNSRNDPVSTSLEKFGILPSFMKRARSCGSMPSIPMTISFWSPCHSPLADSRK